MRRLLPGLLLLLIAGAAYPDQSPTGGTLVLAYISIAPRQCSMVMKRSSFIIDPRGDLYRCAGLAGRREFLAGSINGKECDLFLGTELWRRCAQCPWVPICGDGCPFAAYLRYGDPFALFCPRRSVEYAVKESLKLSYLRGKEKART